jgi:hypothetical protein
MMAYEEIFVEGTTPIHWLYPMHLMSFEEIFEEFVKAREAGAMVERDAGAMVSLGEKPARKVL